MENNDNFEKTTSWEEEYYNVMCEDALKEEDTPDNNGYYL